MDTTYRLVVIGRNGMYTYGATAASPDLARISVGNLLRSTIQDGLHRLGVERTDWRDGNDGPRPVRSVLVEAEAAAGEWAIGAEPSKEG